MSMLEVLLGCLGSTDYHRRMKRNVPTVSILRVFVQGFTEQTAFERLEKLDDAVDTLTEMSEKNC